jgi:hypothetical protein
VPDFSLPTTTRGGSRRWLDPAIEDVARKIHEGDATVGWVGDPRLGLYLATDGPYAGRWELVRWPEDGSPEQVVARARPGVDIRTLPAHLAFHDMRRKDAEKDMEEVFAKEERAAKHRDEEQMGEAIDTWLSRATRHAGIVPQRAS